MNGKYDRPSGFGAWVRELTRAQERAAAGGERGGASVIAAYSDGGTWIGGPSETPVGFGTPIIDEGGDVTLASGGWTINTTGRYVISVEFSWYVDNATVKGFAGCHIVTGSLAPGNLLDAGNGAQFFVPVDGALVYGVSGRNPTQTHTTVPVLFEAGDFFSFDAQCNLAAGSVFDFHPTLLVTVARVD